MPLVAATVLVVFGAQMDRTRAGLHQDSIGLCIPRSWLWAWLSHAWRVTGWRFGAPGRGRGLFFFGPYRPQRWRYVWPGAVLAAVLWLLTTMGFGWYVRHMAHYNVMYGSVGAGIALLVWMYLLAVSALIGCEYNAAYERSVSA